MAVLKWRELSMCAFVDYSEPDTFDNRFGRIECHM